MNFLVLDFVQIQKKEQKSIQYLMNSGSYGRRAGKYSLVYLGNLEFLAVFELTRGSGGVGTKNGGNFEPHFSSRQIDIANKFLDRLYQRARVDFPSEQFLRFDEGLMMGAVAHKWGVSPFHYDDAYYHAAIQQLTVASAPSLHASESFETLLPGGTPLVQRDRGDNKV